LHFFGYVPNTRIISSTTTRRHGAHILHLSTFFIQPHTLRHPKRTIRRQSHDQRHQWGRKTSGDQHLE
ncbi:MAG: hypothetical protein ACPGWR_29740, partial [Ardenticatenaceae bacterium]